jgi:uncharacterized protein YqeY
MSETAPTKQLLVTEHNVTGIIHRYFVKKKDIVDPNIVNTLRHLCKIADKRKDPVITLAIFEARKQILEEACEIYAEAGQDELFDEQMKELNVVMELLKEHTITK